MGSRGEQGSAGIRWGTGTQTCLPRNLGDVGDPQRNRALCHRSHRHPAQDWGQLKEKMQLGCWSCWCTRCPRCKVSRRSGGHRRELPQCLIPTFRAGSGYCTTCAFQIPQRCLCAQSKAISTQNCTGNSGNHGSSLARLLCFLPNGVEG